jgi:hypothetical protein
LSLSARAVVQRYKTHTHTERVKREMDGDERVSLFSSSSFFFARVRCVLCLRIDDRERTQQRTLSLQILGKKNREKKKKEKTCRRKKPSKRSLSKLSKISTRSISLVDITTAEKKRNETINMQSATSSFNGVRIASSARGAGFAKRLFSFLSRFFFAFLCRKKSVACTRRCALTATQFFCFRDSRAGLSHRCHRKSEHYIPT